MSKLIEKEDCRQWIADEDLEAYLEEDWVLLASVSGDPILYYTLVDGECLPDMQPYRDEVWTRVKQIRAQKYAFAPTSYGNAQCDVESRSFISGMVQMAMLAKQAGAPFSRKFTMMDNTEVTFNADQFIDFGLQVGAYVDATHANSRRIFADLQACETLGQLNAVDIEEGWPE